MTLLIVQKEAGEWKLGQTVVGNRVQILSTSENKREVTSRAREKMSRIAGDAGEEDGVAVMIVKTSSGGIQSAKRAGHGSVDATAYTTGSDTLPAVVKVELSPPYGWRGYAGRDEFEVGYYMTASAAKDDAATLRGQLS